MTVTRRLDSPGCGCEAAERDTGLISIDEALRRIAAHSAPLAGIETVPLARATGRILAAPVPANRVAPAGTDRAAAEPVLCAGRRLGPREIAACAAAGQSLLSVRRPVRLGLLVSGEDAPARAASGHVTAAMLSSALAGPSMRLVAVKHRAKGREGLWRQLAALAGAVDLVVTAGGLTSKNGDHLSRALAALGAETAFGGVAVEPGAAVSFGRLGGAHWLGLPGAPLAALVAWQVFGLPLLGGLTGESGAGAPRRHVVLGRDILRQPGRCALRPARIAGFDTHGREVVQFEDTAPAGRLVGLPEADGLILLPADADRLDRGMLVEFQPFRDF